MAKKIYIGNLGTSATDEQLRTLFTPFGKVDSANVIMENGSTVSKGFGFVEMADDHEADAAIKGLSGKEHDGRTLKVNEAKRRAADAPPVAHTLAPGSTSSN